MARKTLVKIRRGTSANWDSTNPTLASGEMAFLTDKNKILFGDGVSEFDAFDGWEKPWARIDGGDIDNR